MSNEDWLFQVSPKLDDGTLVNVRARSAREFIDNMEVLQELSPMLVGVVRTLTAADRTNRPDEMGQAIASVRNVFPDATEVDVPEIQKCKHGRREWVEKPTFKGWFCPTPKGAKDKCGPNFID